MKLKALAGDKAPTHRRNGRGQGQMTVHRPASPEDRRRRHELVGELGRAPRRTARGGFRAGMLKPAQGRRPGRAGDAEAAAVARRPRQPLRQAPSLPAEDVHHPRRLRLRRPASLSGRQPVLGGAPVAGRRRRLWPRQAGAGLRHRSAVPAALQEDAAGASRSSSTSSTCCGTWASRSAMRCARSTTACAMSKADMTIRTALLEARFLCGDRGLFHELERPFRARTSSARHRPGFIEAKLAERDQRHERMGDSRYRPRAQRQGRQGRPARPPHAVLDRQIFYRVDSARAGRGGRLHPARSCGCFASARTSCGRCAATCTS